MAPRRLAVVVASAAVLAGMPAAASGAVTITRADLTATALRVEGTGARPNAALTVSSPEQTVAATADGAGAFRVQQDPFRSSTCQVTVSDGATSASRALAGCTVSGPPPPPPPAPAVTLSPASLTFASQFVGTTSAAQSITVSNTGNASLFINSAAIGGTNTLDFTAVGDGCSGLTLAPGTSCTMSITFSPKAAGTRTATLTVTDNAPGSPQTAALSGTGANDPNAPPPPPMAVDTQFMSCANGVCDPGANRNVFVRNFFSTNFTTTGGTAPFTWSVLAGQLPGGLTLTPAGVLFGVTTATGTSTFTVRVSDANGATATQPMTMTVTPPPPPSPPGCQTGGTLTELLSGSAINGVTPTGRADADESQFTTCGGFTILNVRVDKVNLPNGTVLWVSLDFMPVGTITLSGGTGSMAPYNLGRFGVGFDQVRVVDHPPPRVNGEPTVLIGGSFR